MEKLENSRQGPEASGATRAAGPRQTDRWVTGCPGETRAGYRGDRRTFARESRGPEFGTKTGPGADCSRPCMYTGFDNAGAAERKPSGTRVAEKTTRRIGPGGRAKVSSTAQAAAGPRDKGSIGPWMPPGGHRGEERGAGEGLSSRSRDVVTIAAQQPGDKARTGPRVRDAPLHTRSY